MNASEQATDLLVRKGVQVAAVVDPSFGDNGKGKVVDLFGSWSDVTIRGTGGANAGHTIVHDGKTHVFHLLPSSISRDAEGKLSVVGRGTVVNPGSFAEELQTLDAAGMSSEGLRVSQDAQLVLPWHIALDHLQEVLAGSGRIGTTKQGIGPAYAAHRSRFGVRVNDLLNPDALRKSLARSFSDAALRFAGAPLDQAKEAVTAVEGGVFYHASRFMDVDAATDWLLKKAERFRDNIVDTDALAHSMLKDGKRVLLEGAQGVLLSIDYGTYPFVTSSDCSLAGLAQGAGLRTEDVGYTASIVKAYATRVGEGPFPTEIADAAGESLRKLGNEFGATTGRPRQVGWLDLPLLRHAVRHASRSFALTKADVLARHGTVKVCTSYIYNGPDQRVGKELYTKGCVLYTAIPYPEILDHCTPQYREFPAWHGISSATTHSKAGLEPALLEFVRFIETELAGTVDILSIGPDREDTIIF